MNVFLLAVLIGPALFMQTVVPGQQGLLDLLHRIQVLIAAVLLACIVIFDAAAGIKAMQNNESAMGTNIVKNAAITTVAVIVLIALALSPILPAVVFYILGSSMPT